MREVCLIVPCYNEQRRLNAGRILDFVSARPAASLCFVNDGSSDGTLPLIESLKARCPEQISVLSLDRNSGKAEAVRQGALHVHASSRAFGIMGYWDADLSTPLDEMERLIAALDSRPEHRLALGSRVKRLGSTIDRRATRHYLGRVFSTLSSQLLNLPVYDSQCGAKVFRADITDVIFTEPFITRWLFDVEILVRLRSHLGAEAFRRAAIEVPLDAWIEVGGSKLRLSHMAKVPFELLKIRSNYGTR
jgi:glycosyltransferase involved in cell wall biosynthesis